MNLMKKSFVVSLCSVFCIGLNGLVVLDADDDCYLTYEVDCPISKAYCKIRDEGNCAGNGFENYRGNCAQTYDPLQHAHSRLGNAVPCWASCKCHWFNQECVCDENEPNGPPNSHNEFVWELCHNFFITYE